MTSTKFHSILLNNIHPFYDGIDRACKLLLANDNRIRENIQNK